MLPLPIGSTALKVPSAAMLNILSTSDDMSEITKFEESALIMLSASIHPYGKVQCCQGRKMGHITPTVESVAEIRTRGAQSHKHPLVGVIICSDSDLPVMLPAGHILNRFCIRKNPI